MSDVCRKLYPVKPKIKAELLHHVVPRSLNRYYILEQLCFVFYRKTSINTKQSLCFEQKKPPTREGERRYDFSEKLNKLFR